MYPPPITPLLGSFGISCPRSGLSVTNIRGKQPRSRQFLFPHFLGNLSTTVTSNPAVSIY